MKTKLTYLASVAFGVALGYLLASQWPLISVLIHFSDQTVTQFQRFDLVIRVLAATGTLMAVVVALFKEDIRHLWERANIVLQARDSGWCREVLEGADTDEIGGNADESESDSEQADQDRRNPRARCYEVVLHVKNNGSLPAKSCEVRLDRLTFKATADATEVDVEGSEKAILWRGASEPRMTILPDRHAVVEVARLSLAPTTSKRNASGAVLNIGNTPMLERSGTWNATFSVFGENISLTKITLVLWWNGQWEHRKTEMVRRFTVTEKT